MFEPRYQVENDKLVITLRPVTGLDQSVIDAVGNTTTATVKRNGDLVFQISLPKPIAAKPEDKRNPDEVRDGRTA